MRLYFFPMSIEAADLRKLVKIVRQYEVIYGGGISSSDAALREDCEDLIGLLESELGLRKGPVGRKARLAAALPSLMDAKKKPKDAGESRPLSQRSKELASLAKTKAQEKSLNVKTEPTAKAGAKQAGKPAQKPLSKAAAREAAKAEAKALAQKSAAKAGTAKAEAQKAGAGKAARSGKSTVAVAPVGKAGAANAGSPRASKATAAAEKAITAAQRAETEANDEVYKDVRSRHVGAHKAALERADRIAGSADSSDETESKKRFAAVHLFDAFQQNRLPKYGGFIVCVRFSEDKGYAIVEIIGYENMQDIYPEGETLVFKSVGCKLYALIEPSGYLLKSVEPVNRPNEQAIPYRFSELIRITTKRFQGILIGRKPVFMPTSFSVFKPSGEDLAVLFYNIADVYSNIQDFLIMILRDRLGSPVLDSRKAAEVIARGIREFRLWMDEA
jgi:hypothetical protein